MNFSIVVPTYNAAATLARCLESVAAQRGADHELVVVDGGSSDGTVELLQDHAAPSLRWTSGRDRGVYDAINKGIALARGRWVLVLGADDELAAPDVLERVAAAGGDADILHGRVYRAEKGREEGGAFDAATLLHRNLCQQGLFYRRELFERFGGFDLRYRVCADWAFNLRCLGAGCRAQALDLVVSRYAGTGLSSRVTDEAFYADRLALVADAFGKTLADPLFRPLRWEFLERARALRGQRRRVAALGAAALFAWHALGARAAATRSDA